MNKKEVPKTQTNALRYRQGNRVHSCSENMGGGQCDMTHYTGIDAGALFVLCRHRVGLRACPSAGDVDPFGQAAAILALDVNNVCVASAAAANAILFGGIVQVPVLILFDSLTLVDCRRL